MGNATRFLPRIPRLLLMLLAAIVLVLAFTQCRPVSDAALGVKSSITMGDKGANCASECAKAYNDSIRVESDLHTLNVKACGDDEACQDQEELRHEAAVDRIQTGRQQCIDSCHHQGGGSGGR